MLVNRPDDGSTRTHLRRAWLTAALAMSVAVAALFAHQIDVWIDEGIFGSASREQSAVPVAKTEPLSGIANALSIARSRFSETIYEAAAPESDSSTRVSERPPRN